VTPADFECCTGLNDDVHGVRQAHGVTFPNGCGLGATWSPDALRTVGKTMAVEARADYNFNTASGNRGQQCNGCGITMYGPNMNLVRDPRWGRAQEVYSEDPVLTAALTEAMVTSAQEPLDGPSGSGPMTAAACCKHFAAYDVEDVPVSRVQFDAQVDTRNMWETYLPVFQSCVQNAQAAHVMCSYNSINGVPTCAEPRLLNGILRKQWNWPGFVVSDYDAWANIKNTHNYCGNMTCAAAVGLNAGMDQEGGGTQAIEQLPAALQAGMVSTDGIAAAFERLFTVRIQLGMFDPPAPQAVNYLTAVANASTAAHVQSTLHVAAQSLTLLQNRATGNSSGKPAALPLAASVAPVAIIGAQATRQALLLGNYATFPERGVSTVLDGILQELGVPGTPACDLQQDVDYFVQNEGGVEARGAEECCFLCSLSPSCAKWTFYEGVCYFKDASAQPVSSPGRISGVCPAKSDKLRFAAGCGDVACESDALFPDAVAAVQGAGAVVVLLGLDQTQEYETHDRTEIELPGNQAALVAALRGAVGPSVPIVAVLIHGGTLGLGSVLEDADAILDAYYPGMMGGAAIAQALFGSTNPGGKVPVTYYSSSAQLPAMGLMNLYPNASAGSHGITYRYFTQEPTFPFGHGLSYTSFSLAGASVSAQTVAACDTISVTVKVTNTGNLAGDEVVQVYVQQLNSSTPAPSIRLAAFQRVTLQPGASTSVVLQVAPQHRTVVLDNAPDVYSGSYYVAQGKILVSVGTSQPPYSSPSGGSTFPVSVSTSSPLNACGGQKQPAPTLRGGQS